MCCCILFGYSAAGLSFFTFMTTKCHEKKVKKEERYVRDLKGLYLLMIDVKEVQMCEYWLLKVTGL
jgi:hypothetical protein